MKADESLIAQVEIKATGAVIHDLKGYIGSYRSCEHLIEHGPPERKEFWESKLKEYETILRKFVHTGQLDKRK